MNSTNYFRKIENDIARGDKLENADYCIQADGGKFQMEINGEWQEIATLIGPIITSNNKNLNNNIFCMYAIKDITKYPIINPRCFSFGDTYALLIYGDDFLHRVLQKSKQDGLKTTWGLVEYVNRNTYEGKLGPLKKFDNFAYQSEFRIISEECNESPRKLKIGNISDIARIGNLSMINNDLAIINNKLSVRN